jgi:dihydrolipoamide dehydrogenase
VLTSREALALREVPASIAVVGGGPIGVEFAYLYRSYGADVTLVEMEPRLLPQEDEDVGRQLERSFAAQGITVRTGTTVESVAPDRDGVTVRLQGRGASEELRAERVLAGVGFSPNTEDLGLEAAGVALDRGWVGVDEYCRTSVPGVWAAGDVTGRLLLAHVASHQGVTAVEMIAGRNPPPLDYAQMPRAVYCQPQVAALGLTEAQARERGHEVRVGRFPFRASGKAVATGETEGFVKLVADRETHAVLGVHIVGHGATEMLGEASVAMLLESTTAELAQAVHAHPTLSEAIKEAALAATGEAIHFYTSRRE